MASPFVLLDVVRAAITSGDRRSTEVLDAALECFLDFGIRRSSMGEIARRAGISPATLYKRYSQKNDVVAAVTLREAGRYVAEVDAAIDHNADASEQITELFVAILQGIRRNPLLNRLVTTELDTILPLFTVDSTPTLTIGQMYLSEFMARLQREGKLPAYDPAPLAEFLARLVLSFILNPNTLVPEDDEDARQFGREHIVPLFRLL